MVRRVVWVLGALAAASGTAYALKPGMHADLAKKSCTAAGLPGSFCTRIATEDYNTDEREWDDLRAHAQIDDDETACVAADNTAERLRSLGHDLRDALVKARSRSDADSGAVASLVGRALHTVQDNCAHHGMPNPQHAWFSLDDFCDGTLTSPDVQADAIACARTETDAVMRVVASAVGQANIGATLDAHSCPSPPDSNSGRDGGKTQSVCQARWLPGPFDGCAFLGRAKDWDGIDRRWNNEVVVPALREAFASGLVGASHASSICRGNESVLSPAVSNAIVDVSGGAKSCVAATIFCLGKADDAENPFADDPAPADAPAEAGCDASGAHAGGSATWLLALALVAVRRRRSV